MKIKRNKSYTIELIENAHTLYDGNGLSGTNIQKFDEYMDIIRYNCVLQGFADFSREKNNFIRSLFQPSNIVKSESEFIERCEKAEIEKNVSTEANILYRLHVDLKSAESIIADVGKQYNVRIVEKEEYLKIINDSHTVKTQNQNDETFWNYVGSGVWLICSQKGKNYNSAVLSVINTIENMRALINYSLKYKKLVFQSHPQQYNDISPSKFYFEIENNGIYFWKYSVGDYKYKDHILTKPQIDESLRLIDYIHKLKTTKLRDEIIASIKIYNEALDNYKYDYMYILLWSIIDILIPRIDKNERLLMNLYLKGNQKQSNLIAMLHEKRNRYVHTGCFDIFNERDINYLKLIIEDLIIFCCSVNGAAQTTYDIAYILEKAESEKNIKKEIELLEYTIKIMNS